jgi:hypothetical protein
VLKDFAKKDLASQGVAKQALSSSWGLAPSSVGMDLEPGDGEGVSQNEAVCVPEMDTLG